MDWTQYDSDQILKGVDPDGNRLLSLFANDYKKTMGTEICPSCSNLSDKLKALILKKQRMAKAKKQVNLVEGEIPFKLKKMYQNITTMGSRKYYNDENLTESDAILLAAKHPKGIGLFDTYPTDWEEKVKAINEPSKIISIDGTEYTPDQISSVLLAMEIEVLDGSIEEINAIVNGLTPEKLLELKEMLITI
jgi:hypothetical protein